MGLHRIYVPTIAGDSLVIGGEEARHAVRVKRLTQGDAAQVLDGAGTIATGRIAEIRRHGRAGDWELVVSIDRRETVEPLSPRVDVLSAVPKADRAEWMIDALCQVGAWSWRPLACARGVAEAGSVKLARLARHAQEACKQSGRAWAMGVDDRPTDVREAVRLPGAIVAHASGEAYARTGSPELAILVGPEGGFTDEELALARDAGARIHAFGPHTMRIEVAAVASAAIAIDRERR